MGRTGRAPAHLFISYILSLIFLLSLHSFLHVMPKAQVVQPPVHRRTYSDPLSAALLPPPDETPFAREARLKAESDAKKISDSIDDMLHKERNEKKKIRPEVNVLLLGQSESGKSTTLKRETVSFCGFFTTYSLLQFFVPFCDRQKS